MIPGTNQPAVDLSYLKIDAQRRLLKLLDKFEGTKAIVWDDKLIGPFEFVASASLLRKHDATKLFRLSDARLTFTSDNDHILFFLRKDYQAVKFVADVLQRADKTTLAKVSLVFVPQRCASIENLLEQNKLSLDKLYSIQELDVDLFVLDTDILSMENECVYRDMYLNEDFSSVHQIVQGLNKLQDIYGQIPRISGQGKAAKLVTNLLLKNRKLQPTQTSDTITPHIQHLVLIDRRIDLITPFITQLTYEGLLDEIFNINYGSVILPGDKFEEQEPKKFELKSSEELYSRLRDCHINAVADTLKQSAQNLKTEYDECSSEGKSIHEMSKIVKRLHQLKIAKNSHSNHVAIAELLNEQTLKPEFILGLRIEHELLQDDRLNRVITDIETKLLRQEPALNVLRLICLQSILNNGLKPKVCDFYRKEIIENYGFEYLLFLLHLEKTNLLVSPERINETASFNQLKSKFNLINDNVNECNPDHLSYVYGGYSPLSVMVIKSLIRGEKQTASLLGGAKSAGESFLYNVLSSANSASSVPAQRVRRNSAVSSQSSSDDTRVVLVFFIGGCTFAEISALRYLSQQEDNNCEFLVATTKIINGTSFLKSLWPLNSGRTGAV